MCLYVTITRSKGNIIDRMKFGIVFMNYLFSYLQSFGLPDKKISIQGEISRQFIEYDIKHFYQAIYFLHQLPYGRTSDRANYHLVLPEQRGACSTKHALLAALAEELNLPIQLGLGIFLMNVNNTPKIRNILKKHQLVEIPEAHCFLQYQNHKFDITFPEMREYSVKVQFIKEMFIKPSDIGDFKINWHKQAIQEWLMSENLPNSLEEIWSIRELCIKILSSSRNEK